MFLLLLFQALTTVLKKTGLLGLGNVSPLEDIFHKVDDTAGHNDAKPMEPPHENRSLYRGVNRTWTVADFSKAQNECSTNTEILEIVERKRRDVDIPFSYVGSGYTFNQEAFDEVLLKKYK